MRHFFSLPISVGLLPMGMMEGSLTSALVTLAGSAKGISPGERRAGAAIEIASVAVTAQADLAPAAPAIEQAICLVHPASVAGMDWTRQEKKAMLTTSQSWITLR